MHSILKSFCSSVKLGRSRFNESRQIEGRTSCPQVDGASSGKRSSHRARLCGLIIVRL